MSLFLSKVAEICMRPIQWPKQSTLGDGLGLRHKQLCTKVLIFTYLQIAQWNLQLQSLQLLQMRILTGELGATVSQQEAQVQYPCSKDVFMHNACRFALPIKLCTPISLPT